MSTWWFSASSDISHALQPQKLVPLSWQVHPFPKTTSLFYRFIETGHETTSAATAWALFSLTQSPDVQYRLREELLQISTESPTMEDLNGLPYLDAFVRETLRLHSPVATLTKSATEDDMIPLDKPFIDNKGNTQRAIK